MQSATCQNPIVIIIIIVIIYIKMTIEREYKCYEGPNGIFA